VRFGSFVVREVRNGGVVTVSLGVNLGIPNLYPKRDGRGAIYSIYSVVLYL